MTAMLVTPATVADVLAAKGIAGTLSGFGQAVIILLAIGALANQPIPLQSTTAWAGDAALTGPPPGSVTFFEVTSEGDVELGTANLVQNMYVTPSTPTATCSRWPGRGTFSNPKAGRSTAPGLRVRRVRLLHQPGVERVRGIQVPQLLGDRPSGRRPDHAAPRRCWGPLVLLGGKTNKYTHLVGGGA